MWKFQRHLLSKGNRRYILVDGDKLHERNYGSLSNQRNFICIYDITLMAESEEELKSLFMKVKEESEKVGFKAQHSEN